MNINYELLKEQRDHLLSILWHDNKGEGVHGLLDEEMGWGIVHLLDSFLDKDYYEQQNLSMGDKCNQRNNKEKE